MLTANTRKAILDNIAGIANTTMPRGLYLALSTTTPADDGTNFTEPASSKGYSRVYIGPVTQEEPRNYPFEWVPAESGEDPYTQIWNQYEIHFNAATDDWGSVTYLGIFTAATGGSLVAYSELSSPVTVSAQSIPTIAQHEAVLTIDFDVLNMEF